MSSEFRRLPSVDRLLADRRIKRLSQTCSHTLLVDLVRKQLEDARRAIKAGGPCPAIDEIVAAVSAQLNFLESPSLHPVVNATGVILHTNLGRALLSQEAISAMDAVASGYCNLEYDLNSGRRGSRQVHVEPILCQLTGAEAALVVNNNAAGVLLALTALAKRKEVIVSRGQAVEIGGSFRIPDVMRQSGAKLIEVGTTNCTYITDYEEALSPRTAALMRVHASNFRQIGFIHEASLEELIDLGKCRSVPVFDDLGSGCFLDTAAFGLDPEPMVPQSVSAGAALTLFSGDKLVGGPQAGIIVGRPEYVAKLRRHPLARAVRIDKIRLAGMVATLIHYLKGEALTKIPVWRMISTPITEIDRRAHLWAQALGSRAKVIDGETMVGGGSLPGGTLPTKLVTIGGQSKSPGRAQSLAQKLRLQKVPVIGRINEDILLLDPRTVLPEEDKIVLGALRGLAAGLK